MLYRHGTSREVKARPLMEIDGGRTLRARYLYRNTPSAFFI